MGFEGISMTNDIKGFTVMVEKLFHTNFLEKRNFKTLLLN